MELKQITTKEIDGLPRKKGETWFLLNALLYKWFEKTISYEDISILSGKSGLLTITYNDRINDKAGTLITGESIEISHGMIINANLTNNA